MEAAQSTPVAFWVGEHFYWVMIGILVINLMQRKHQAHAEKKRFATLYLALAVFAVYVAAQLVLNYGGSDALFLLIAAVVLVGLVYFHDRTFPFRLRSPIDRRWLTMQEILFDDAHGDRPAEDTPEDATPEGE